MDKKTYNNLLVSSAPHIVTNMDTTRIMMMVLIGLAPSFLASIYIFGAKTVISLTLVCAVASVCFEWAWNKLMHKKQTIGDLSAVVTGVLIAFNVPAGCLNGSPSSAVSLPSSSSSSYSAASAKTLQTLQLQPESCCSSLSRPK